LKELEDLEVYLVVQPIRNRSAAVGCGGETILRYGFNSILVEAEGCVSVLLGQRTSDRPHNVYVGCRAVYSHDQRDQAIASNLLFLAFSENSGSTEKMSFGGVTPSPA
jgi:hypothetical protein